MKDQDQSRIKKLVIATLMISVLAGLLISAPTTQAEDLDTQNGILMYVNVHAEEDALDNATVELVDSNGTVLDSDLTDTDGNCYLYHDANLTDAKIRVNHDDYDDTLTKTSIDLDLPPTNETNVQTYSFSFEKSYTQEAEGLWADHPYMVLGGGAVLLIGVFTVIEVFREKTGW